MSRLHSIEVAQATGQAAELFTAIKAKIGKVPNAYATIASNSPLALGAALALDGTLAKSSLSTKQIEIVKLVASEVAACDYCLAAHTLVGKGAGLSTNDILAVRRGVPSGDPRTDALADFVRSIVSTRGTVPAEVLAAVKAADYSDAQIVDTLLAISSITFTNLFNRVNDTAIDFPPAD